MVEGLRPVRQVSSYSIAWVKNKIMDLIVVLTFYSQRTELNLVEGNCVHVSYNLQLVLVWHCCAFKAQLFLPAFHQKSVFDLGHLSFEIKECDIFKRKLLYFLIK